MPLTRIATAHVEPHWSLKALRIGIGIAGLAKLVLIADNLYRFASPSILKTPYAFSPPLPDGPLLAVFVALWAAAAFSLAAGFHPRVSARTLCACLVYYMSCDQQFLANHGILIAIGAFLVSFLHASPIPYWPIFLLRFQISFVYWTTGIAKLNPEFLSGDVLREVTTLPDAAAPAFAWMAIAAELALPLLLWIPRTRALAFLVGAALHTFIVLTMTGKAALAVFSWTAIVYYFAFLAKPVTCPRAETRAPIR